MKIMVVAPPDGNIFTVGCQTLPLRGSVVPDRGVQPVPVSAKHLFQINIECDARISKKLSRRMSCRQVARRSVPRGFCAHDEGCDFDSSIHGVLVDCEATRFLSAAGVVHMIAVASRTFITQHDCVRWCQPLCLVLHVGVLIASVTEVAACCEAHALLTSKGVHMRVVSVPF